MTRYTCAALVAWVMLSSAATTKAVPYEKYTLPNGMTVILHEDHTLPVASVNIWYYVGGKDERPGRSGFAHLFEHLMFMGTKRVAGSDFDNIMEAGGGWNNATTSEDRTNYFEMGPAELLPTLLWLEADRLEDLGKYMTQEKLDKQREVVRNERRQSYENRPYGKADLRVIGLMFPEGHPYHIPVIGTHEDLEAATVEDVKNFFGTYYVPSNASLVVAGDFNPTEVKPLIAKLFGTLPRGSDVVHAAAKPVKLDKLIRVTETDNVEFARTIMVYHSPAHFASGDAEMDLAAAVLSSGISSRLYQKLIYENELAIDVNAYQASMLLGSLFFIEATAKEGVSQDSLETAIDEVLREFVAKGPTKAELERERAQVEFRTLRGLQSILSRANLLNSYQFFFGEPDSFKRDLDRYRNATTEDVRSWAEKTLTPDARLILRVVPELKSPKTNPRDAQPQVATAAAFSPLVPDTFALSNGITVHYWQRKELPLTNMTVMFPYGTTSDPKGRAGLATLTADMLDEGCGTLSAVAFADALDQLGASFNVSSGLESTTASLSVLSRNFGEALALASSAIMAPRFDSKEWRRVHDLHVQELKQRLDQPTYVASTVSMRAFFGDLHPFSRPRLGTVVTAQATALEEAKIFHERLYRPSAAVIFVASNLTKADIRTELEKTFGPWRDAKETPGLTAPSFAAARPVGRKLYIVDRPGAVQTVIRFTMPGAAYNDPRRIPLQLFNTILGGSFTSRLNQNLREAKGYTYGARSSFTMSPSVGYLTAGSSVRADVTGASIGEFLKEFAAIRSGDITNVEAHKTRTTQRMRTMQAFEGLGGIIGAGVTLVRNGQPFAQLAQDLDAMAKIGNTDLNRLAYDAIPLDQSVLVLVGDRDRILKQIQDLDLPNPIELTTTGDPK